MNRLQAKELKEYREKQLHSQKNICPLCETEVLPEEATLDHCHVTGHVRQVLHRSCNAAEGRILSWAGRRSRGDDPVKFLKNLLKYWGKSYLKNPIHPIHGKKRKRKRRART